LDHDGGRQARMPSTIIASWPKGSFAENLAVDRDGAIYVSLHTDQRIERVAPDTGRVTPFASFDLPIAGLSFAADGALYVSGGHPGRPPGVLWRVDRNRRVERIATLDHVAFFNGMTPHPDGKRLLVADSIGGVIHALDITDGRVDAWLADDRLKPLAGDWTPGANGVKLFGGHVYVSVTARDALYRAPLDGSGRPGPLELVAEHLRADDFAFDTEGNLYIATHPAHSLVRLTPRGERSTLAGVEQGLLCATAVAFGRTPADDHSVYVTTTGGTLVLPVEQGETAKLVRVAVGAKGQALLSPE